MGVITTPNLYKALTFDGASSRTYGVYITGEAVYNAPERAVEMISIPGRNGAFVLDKGHFENIEVSYPAGIFAENEEDFAKAISDFRNLLCSKVGYCRLTDEYNPDEYRLAVYKSGLEVSPEQLKAGEFNLVFDCKPQRFLTSGETAVSIANNGSINNPTLFKSSPLLLITGSGSITIGGKKINISSQPIGDIILSTSESYGNGTPRVVSFNGGLLETGNNIKSSAKFKIEFAAPSSMTFVSIAPDYDDTLVNMDIIDFDLFNGNNTSGWKKAFCEYTTNTLTFVKGTQASGSESAKIKIGFGQSQTFYDETLTMAYSYDGGGTITYSFSKTSTNPQGATVTYCGISPGDTTAVSTRLAIIDPIYIDLDIGEAYIIDNGEPVSVNNSVYIGADLPTLNPGQNTITYDNTITSFKITPRWWKV